MKKNRFLSVMLAVFVTVSMSACAKDKVPESTSSSKANTTSTTTKTTGATENTTTNSETQSTEVTTSSENKKEAECVTMHYGWDREDEDFVTTIYCPDGAEFSDETKENQGMYGWTEAVNVEDKVEKYAAMSVTYWQREVYTQELMEFPIMAQLYYDGEIDAEAAQKYSDCSQEVIPLGFKWEGKDVFLVKTTYTYEDSPNQLSYFAGVECEITYKRFDENSNVKTELVEKALFGFDMYSYDVDDLTQEQCAWIISELFGVKSGAKKPF